ncbi:ABC transporter ATP-binding protein [Histidinibacterium aquaticum]|uniref:sn-glycerol-3-phosphate ABC transporter ATP-binding protein UgpC n=1 Tax=Histidinibacterium aquaticum TaxID=2613962 RepID=A0A5J5GJ13_9RHOB|nr:sn-glycerol-3-phosphate ABC transporter ATP-binding protein UgpC [Histidinibacterium aquaticum]KAA9008145.1 sn-glycerol-3-phosphate ABC transporter ATP-binding protein UgpC [Histidinibacterium aquaticum]
MANVQLSNVTKRFGAVEVIKGVDIEIEDGEFTVFVGPSGCGKSTLLRMIAGLEDITSGTLSIGGRVVNDLQPKERGVGMVFQSYAIFPHMTVRENIGFGLTIARESKAEKTAKVEEAARILQMENLLDRRPSQLSGGQRQRVAIGRAIVRNPSVFLFDEPLSNLDAALRMDMRMEIGKLHKQLGATMVYVTHDQVEAMTLADKIVVLKEGRVMQVGAPMELYHNPANLFVAGFLGAPSMNFLDVEVMEVDGGEARVRNASLEPIVVKTAGRAIDKGSTAVLGVRPQYLEPAPAGSGMLHGEVRISERLGSETVVDLALRDGTPLIAAFGEDKVFEDGQPLDLSFDSASAHLFPREA